MDYSHPSTPHAPCLQQLTVLSEYIHFPIATKAYNEPQIDIDGGGGSIASPALSFPAVAFIKHNIKGKGRQRERPSRERNRFLQDGTDAARQAELPVKSERVGSQTAANGRSAPGGGGYGWRFFPLTDRS